MQIRDVRSRRVLCSIFQEKNFALFSVRYGTYTLLFIY